MRKLLTTFMLKLMDICIITVKNFVDFGYNILYADSKEAHIKAYSQIPSIKTLKRVSLEYRRN